MEQSSSTSVPPRALLRAFSRWLLLELKAKVGTMLADAEDLGMLWIWWLSLPSVEFKAQCDGIRRGKYHSEKVTSTQLLPCIGMRGHGRKMVSGN